MRRRRLALTPALLLTLAACSGGATTSATDGGSATSSASASGSSSTATATATASATATSGGSESASGSTDPSGSTTTADPSATGTTSAGTGSGTTAGTDGTSGTGGPAKICEELGDVDFGDCEAIVGVIFDGVGCRTVSGCGCEPHCDAVFADPAACAATCAAAGECNLGIFEGKGIAKGPWDMSAFCDEISVCGGEVGEVGGALPGATCEAQAGYPCDGASGCMTDPGGGPGIPADLWEELCAASLLPGVSLVACVVYR